MKTDWKWQIANAIRTPEALRKHFPSAVIDEAACARFPMCITPYYLGLIKRPDFSDPIYAQCVPQGAELNSPPWLSCDPLGEERQSPVPGLLRRYPDRALLVTHGACPVRCRHCMRKRETRDQSPESQNKALDSGLWTLDSWMRYLRAHPEIKDVLISGGEPLMLPERQLSSLLKAVRSVKSVDIIRIATRIPVTLPQRITPRLARTLALHAPLYLVTHFNHPAEITRESAKALKLLADAGIPLCNQTVLLRGVNDNAETIETLCRALLVHRVRPYYLFQCDLVEGTEHFRTPLQTGLDIMAHLRGRLSGLGIPHFALDTPEGGKVEMLPAAEHRRKGCATLFKTSTGKCFEYPDPTTRTQEPKNTRTQNRKRNVLDNTIHS